MKRIITNAFLLFGSIGFATGLSEIVVRWGFPQPVNGPHFKVLTSGLKVNRDAGVSLYETTGKAVFYHFYPFHLRDTPQNPSATPVLVLGDSYTFGWGLQAEETYLHLLQKRIDQAWKRPPNRRQLLNAGTGGWGTGDELAYLETFGDRIKPRAVVVFISNDDIGRAYRNQIYRPKSGSTNVLERRQLPVPAMRWLTENNAAYDWAVQHSHLARLFRNAVLNRTLKRPQPYQLSKAELQEAVLLGQALFLRMQDWCARRGIPLLLLTTGYHDPQVQDGNPTKTFMATAPDFFQKHRFTFYDISAASWEARKAKPSDWVFPDLHPNVRGAEQIATLSWPVLQQFLIRHLPPVVVP